MRRLVAITLMGFLAPAPVAALDWAVWSEAVGNASTGTFSSGQTVELLATFPGGSNVPAGGEYTSSAPIPGTTGSTNPSFIRILTGAGPTIAAGDPIATLGLGDIAVDPSTTFGLADQRTGRQYRLELRDAADALLPLAGVQVTPYDVTYTDGGLIADYNSLLIGDLLLVDGAHDAGGFYLHTGLTTFSNLPAATRSIRLVSNVFQDAEGIQVYLAIAAPAPPEGWLGGASAASLALLHGARRSARQTVGPDRRRAAP